MAAYSARIPFNLAKPELRAKEAVKIYPAVNAILLHDLDVGNGAVIPKGERVLVQPFDWDTAHSMGETLRYNIFIIKKLPSGELPEDKRNIEVEATHFVEVQNHYHNRPKVMKMPIPFPLSKTTPEAVRAYLNKNGFAWGSTAIVRSPGGRFYYVNQEGVITELSILPDFKKWLNEEVFSKQKSQLDTKDAFHFYDQFENFSHFGYIEYYGTVNKKAPIFPTPDSPCLEDICQKLVPDCFLLAALQSILNYSGGKEFIKGMMTDNGDGTINVRLFDPETLAPCFVTVSKAALAEEETPLNRHKALWVHILETAYVALGRKTDSQVGSSAAAVFTNGGNPEFALKILIGKESEYNFVPLPLPKEEGEIPSFMTIESFQAIPAIRAAFKDMPEFLNEHIKMSIKAIFSDIGVVEGKLKYDSTYKMRDMSEESIEVIEKLTVFYEDNAEKYEEILSKNISMPEKIRELLALLIEKKADKQIIDLFCSIISVPFSGVYNEITMNMYKKIEDNLDKGNLITVGSRFSEHFQDTGFEPLPGIPCRHGYSVHRVGHKKEFIDGEERTIFYVQLRNPWGRKGRKYINVNGEIAGQESDDALFYVELNEFITVIDRVIVTDTRDLFYFNRLQAELRAILNENDFNFNREMTDDEWLRNKKLLDEFSGKFFLMEMLHLSYISNEIKSQIQLILKEERDPGVQMENILNLLKDPPQNIPFYVGDDENKNLYLFKLFKLQEALENKNSAPDYLFNLKKEIVEMSGYIFDQKLLDAQVQFNSILKDKVADFNAKMKMLQSFLLKVPSEIDKFSEEAESFLSCKNSMIEKHKNLFKEIKDSRALLEELGYSLSAREEKMFNALIADMEFHAQNSTSNLKDRFESELEAIKTSLSTLSSERSMELEPEEYQMRINLTLNAIGRAIMDGRSILIDLTATHHPLASDMKKRLDAVCHEAEAMESSFANIKVKEDSSNGQKKFGFHSAKASPSRETPKTPKHLNHFSEERYRYGNHR